MQIAARINQDQNISKDLTLWNQQGSQVVRGQTLVLPVDDTFLYVEPIYIQATEAHMPQLKKVVLAEGNTLIYADTYDQALAQLSGAARAVAQAALAQPPTTSGSTPGQRPRASAPLSRAIEPRQVGGSRPRAGGNRGGGKTLIAPFLFVFSKLHQLQQIAV
jgi:uncharacterized membrane protein (UPF0182 family)